MIMSTYVYKEPVLPQDRSFMDIIYLLKIETIASPQVTMHSNTNNITSQNLEEHD